MSTEPTETTRQQAEAAAIEEGPVRIAEDLELRTFTSLSFDRCLRFDIRLAVAGQEAIEAMTGFDVMREAAFVGWMQTAPRAEVSAAFAAGEDAVWEAVDEWEAAFNERDDPPWQVLISEVARVVVRAKLLMLRIQQTDTARDLAKDGETPPPN